MNEISRGLFALIAGITDIRIYFGKSDISIMDSV